MGEKGSEGAGKRVRWCRVLVRSCDCTVRFSEADFLFLPFSFCCLCWAGQSGGYCRVVGRVVIGVE